MTTWPKTTPRAWGVMVRIRADRKSLQIYLTWSPGGCIVARWEGGSQMFLVRQPHQNKPGHYLLIKSSCTRWWALSGQHILRGSSHPWVKAQALDSDRTKSDSQLQHLLAVCPWTAYLTSLGLFLHQRFKIPTLQAVEMIKRENLFEGTRHIADGRSPWYSFLFILAVPAWALVHNKCWLCQ